MPCHGLPRNTPCAAASLWPGSVLCPDIGLGALEANPNAEALAQFYHTAYVRWIDTTKHRPDLRAQRIAETIRLLDAS